MNIFKALIPQLSTHRARQIISVYNIKFWSFFVQTQAYIFRQFKELIFFVQDASDFQRLAKHDPDS